MHDNISTHDLIISVFKALFHVDIKAILKKLLRETASTGQTTVRIAKGVGGIPRSSAFSAGRQKDPTPARVEYKIISHLLRSHPPS
jgi:hypothetical protein